MGGEELAGGDRRPVRGPLVGRQLSHLLGPGVHRKISAATRVGPKDGVHDGRAVSRKVVVDARPAHRVVAVARADCAFEEDPGDRLRLDGRGSLSKALDGAGHEEHHASVRDQGESAEILAGVGPVVVDDHRPQHDDRIAILVHHRLVGVEGDEAARVEDRKIATTLDGEFDLGGIELVRRRRLADDPAARFEDRFRRLRRDLNVQTLAELRQWSRGEGPEVAGQALFTAGHGRVSNRAVLEQDRPQGDLAVDRRGHQHVAAAGTEPGPPRRLGDFREPERGLSHQAVLRGEPVDPDQGEVRAKGVGPQHDLDVAFEDESLGVVDGPSRRLLRVDLEVVLDREDRKDESAEARAVDRDPAGRGAEFVVSIGRRRRGCGGGSGEQTREGDRRDGERRNHLPEMLPIAAASGRIRIRCGTRSCRVPWP